MDTEYFGPKLIASSKEYRDKLDKLGKVPGTCIFIDVCGSTELKNKSDSKYWIPVIGNTLSVGQKLPFLDNPLKVIGDELMYFIPDEEVKWNKAAHATMMQSLTQFVSTWGYFLDETMLHLKAAIHYTTEVYQISYFGSPEEPQLDFYGSGIDLSARLMSVTDDRVIIVSDDFLRVAQPEYPEFLSGLSGPFYEHFKGFPEETKYWKKKV